MITKKIDFAFNNLSYHDHPLEITVSMTVKGYISYTISDEAAPDEAKLKEAVSQAVLELSDHDISYDMIHRERSTVLQTIQEHMDLYGVEAILDLSFTEIHPADQDFLRIAEARRRIAENMIQEEEDGSVSESEVSDTWICSKCGTEVEGNFCRKCGTPRGSLA